MRLLLDEMLSPVIAEQLRRRGHDVDAVAERSDLRTRSDETIFATAQAEARAVVTANIGDFRRIARETIRMRSSHYGLILVTDSAPRSGRRRSLGSIVIALDALIASGVDLRDQEHWLA